MRHENSTVKITVKGIVQGVGFRYYITRAAKELNITGYAKNLYTGEVEILAEGARSSLEKIIEIAQKGPPHSRVESCKVDWLEFENKYRNFEII